jgi:hypothetical protein
MTEDSMSLPVRLVPRVEIARFVGLGNPISPAKSEPRRFAGGGAGGFPAAEALTIHVA